MLSQMDPFRASPQPQETQSGNTSLSGPSVSVTPPRNIDQSSSQEDFSSSTSAPTMSNTTTNVTSHPIDPLDEPPPYTPRADPSQGETTVEYGPSRPFQPPSHQTRQPQQPQPRPTQPTYLSPHPTGSSNRGRGLWQQLSESLDQIANQIERHATGVSNRHYVYPQRTGTSWPSHPGQTRTLPPRRVPSPIPSSSQNPPPLPPRRQRSSSVSNLEASESSDFARDFYAAGTGDGLTSEPDGSESSQRQNHSPPPQRTPDNRGPTTTPVPGRPLLHDGQLLVYPRGYSCEKCYNTGYKQYDPLRPCRKCWTKYGKPFSGPLAYSYSSSASTSNTQNINLQKPLPQHIAGPPRRQAPPLPPRPHLNGYHSAPSNGQYNRGPTIATVSAYGGPPPGAVVYSPGDPRIGGNLCWSCRGKGTMNVLIDSINCPICGGCGRTFSVY